MQIEGEKETLLVTLKEGLERAIASQIIAKWVELRCVDTLLEDIAVQSNGVDPLRPWHRNKLKAAREKVQHVQEHLLALNVDVVLLEPLPEELGEMLTWMAEPFDSLSEATFRDVESLKDCRT